jgi:hypothetical protein
LSADWGLITFFIDELGKYCKGKRIKRINLSYFYLFDSLCPYCRLMKL